MNAKIRFVLNGFRNLSKEERKEFFKIIEDFDKYPTLTEQDIEKSIGVENFSENFESKSNSIVFGPSPSGCTCCGK
ncbi:hypothetical protein [Vreelandella titanicae]|uniref:hypothetical protein n=1 Tax=Vreelandella titanicae TaxID=664683 RepID=UPI0038080099